MSADRHLLLQLRRLLGPIPSRVLAGATSASGGRRSPDLARQVTHAQA